jgi:uncharacterized protein
MDDPGDSVPLSRAPQPTRLLPRPAIVDGRGRDGSNSPLTVAGVLAMVLAFVLAVALLGKTSPVMVAGTPVPVGAPPVAAAPGAGPDTGGNTGIEPKSVFELQTNPLLADGISLAPVTCQLPAISRDPEKLRAYYQAAIGCLDQAWQPVLARVHEPFSSPRLEITAGRSLCGEAPAADQATAYYCSGGQVLFMPTDRLLDQAGLNQAAHLAVLAHEYGHHVQALSGILNAAYDKGEKAGKGSPEKLELTRRTELQANCFSGMFIAAVAGHGSVSVKLAKAAVESFRDTVPDDTHGTVKHQVAWGRAGFDNNRTASCNTWLAKTEDVS